MKKPGRSKTFVLGVTGAFGSGKSTAARWLCGTNGLLIDADAIGHALLEPGSPAYAKVVAAFGTADRGRLGKIVFARGGSRGRTALSRLNRIMHPLIKAEIKRRIAACAGGLVVLDAPLLYETQLHKAVDAVVVVAADERRRLARLCRRAGYTRKERLEAIDRSQMPLEKKIRKADFVIDNNASKMQTKKQAVCIRRQVWRS